MYVGFQRSVEVPVFSMVSSGLRGELILLLTGRPADSEPLIYLPTDIEPDNTHN